jgi:hypothetical protein
MRWRRCRRRGEARGKVSGLRGDNRIEVVVGLLEGRSAALAFSKDWGAGRGRRVASGLPHLPSIYRIRTTFFGVAYPAERRKTRLR